MRHLAILLYICLSIGCTTTRKTNNNSNILNGTWIPVNQEMGGKELPTAAFEKEKLIINDNLYTVIAESVDKGELKYRNGKMDVYGKEVVIK